MKKKTPTLTIITICYNIKDEIERTCESIVNQTWQDFEWIVVDGGSTDGTVAVLKKYADRIDVLISEKDSGIYNAMNKGIKLAHSEWLNFMNGGDCFAANDVLEKVFKNKEYDADILYGDVKVYRTDGTSFIKTHPSEISKNFLRINTICHQSSFIKYSIFKKFGLYNEKLKIVSDWEIFVRAFTQHKKFKYIDLLISNFYLGGISGRIESCQTERKMVIYKFLQYIKNIRYFLFGFIPLLKIEEK